MIYEKIWQKILNPSEKVVYEFSISDRYRKFVLIDYGMVSITLFLCGIILFFCEIGTEFFLFAIGLSIVVFLIGLFYCGFYLKIANAYAFTDRRVIVYRGWLSTNTISVAYEKITDVTVSEPFLERVIFHTGHLSINSAGTPVHEIILNHITRPYEIKKKLDQIRIQGTSRT